MVFEEKSKGLIIKRYTNGIDRHLFIDNERATNLNKIQKVYEKEVLKKMSYNLLFKISIDCLISKLEELSEEEAIEYLKELHIKAFF